jgi:hypothetical protein
VREDHDALIAVPQLNVVAVYVLLGLLFGRLIVFAEKLYAVFDVTVWCNYVDSIITHGRFPDGSDYITTLPAEHRSGPENYELCVSVPGRQLSA